MMIGKGCLDGFLSEADIRQVMAEALAQTHLDGQRVLAIIPDSTRTAPIPLFFRLLHEMLRGQAAALDFLVALGTHPPMREEALNRLVGVTEEERATIYSDVHIINHRWEAPNNLITLGIITAAESERLSNGRLSLDIPVRINRLVQEYDHLLICGPVFPHEVAGFSGGDKYLFPGISGPEIIDFTHWLGALITSREVIGIRNTPARDVIARAASLVQTPTSYVCMVVRDMQLAGLYVGEGEEAWSAAVALSERLHVVYLDRPVQRVLSILPDMYDDMWTGAKGMYKLEPVVADGGEIIIYAPKITELSYTHGRLIDQVGYHVRGYFVKQWEQFKHYPWGILAHSTHLRGTGTYENGIENPRIAVTLATGIPRERCEKVNLGYLNPAEIDISQRQDREHEGILVVPRAGEILYRLAQ
jgi:nickel-dependent lactate racemase